ncbi:PID-CTERM protein-sorting domain-containing protein [Mariniflexile aquimaris]|uniref:PID-CTERM protein-sorting domain-containing protein n=1 Tax=Mariniflexile aquimaris TaxID=881009 RepID=A0ABW3BMD6_9FLAO
MNASTSLSSGGSWYSFFVSIFGGDRDRGDRDRGDRDRDGGRNHRHFRGCGHDGGSQGGGDTIPIDGGLGILLVGAAAFGVKKLRENKNEKN